MSDVEEGYPWTAVLFDLDGTLADTIGLIVECYQHTMRAHLGHVPSEDRWVATIGTPLREQLRDFARSEDEVDEMARTYSARQSAIHDDRVQPFPGAAALTRTLRARGTGVGVVTSKRRGMAVRTLERCGLGEAYDILVGADDVVKAKPDPEPVLQALERLGANSGGRTLFVGDSPFDMRAGRGAGTLTAAALWGPFAREVLAEEHPDFFVDRLPDVLGLRP